MHKNGVTVADQEFANPRLAQLYDFLDDSRRDLVQYAAAVEEFNAQSVLDIGCGTGTLLCLLADKGYKLVGVDPAAASLDVAKRKDGADKIKWILGDAAAVPLMSADIAFMTGNVAQVFIKDEDWLSALCRIREALAPKGYFIFECRDAKKRAWEQWNRQATFSETHIPGVGTVVSWVELTDISLPLVSLQWTYEFKQDGSVLKSDSTLCFREVNEVACSLQETGFNLVDIRDSPDRLGKEHIFIAQKNGY